jgi:transcriptional regulator NrdR family protein
MHESTTPPAGPEAHVGFRCRRCGHQQFRVIYTRPAAGGIVIRRRACRHCGTRISTKEREIGG